MAAPVLQVDVVSTEGSVFSGEAHFVALPGESGAMGVYPRHAPLITRIRPGVVRITPRGGGEELLVFVAGGLLEVLPTRITVLADTAIRGTDIDEARALEALEEAKIARERALDRHQVTAVEAEIALLAAQLHAARGHRGR